MPTAASVTRQTAPGSGLSSPPLRSSDGQIEAIVETPIGFTAPHLVEDLLELFVQRGG
jgi:hypothetical protein